MFTSPWLVLLCITTKLVPGLQGPGSPPSACSLGPTIYLYIFFFHVDKGKSEFDLLLLYIFIATLAQISGLTY